MQGYIYLQEKEDGRQFLEKYYSVWNQYQQALAGIVPIFNYMVRKLKLNTQGACSICKHV